MSDISKEQCIEFAQLEALRIHHWRLLTGVECHKDDSFIYGQEGIFPVQYTDEELSGLTVTEQFEIGEICATEPLRFPCLPSELLHFIDNLVLGDFSVPDDFRDAVERSKSPTVSRVKIDSKNAEIEFAGTFAEVISNGKAIDWRYWMSMRTLSAQEASRLMVGLDPDIFRDLGHSGTNCNDTSGQCDRAKKIERLALNLGLAEAPAADWLSWAKSHGFNIHGLFAVEVNGNEAQTKAGGKNCLAAKSMADEVAGSDSLKHVFRQPRQDEIILKTIRELGFDPGNLPPITPGRPWVKSMVWAIVKDDNGFSEKVFEKAWERFNQNRKK